MLTAARLRTRRRVKWALMIISARRATSTARRSWSRVRSPTARRGSTTGAPSATARSAGAARARQRRVYEFSRRLVAAGARRRAPHRGQQSRLARRSARRPLSRGSLLSAGRRRAVGAAAARAPLGSAAFSRGAGPTLRASRGSRWIPSASSGSAAPSGRETRASSSAKSSYALTNPWRAISGNHAALGGESLDDKLRKYLIKPNTAQHARSLRL